MSTPEVDIKVTLFHRVCIQRYEDSIMNPFRSKFQYSQKEDYGKVPEYLIEKRRQEEEAQREYDAYIQVRHWP